MIGFGLSMAVVAGGARPAQACGSGGGPSRVMSDLAVLALAAVDLAFTATDITHAGKGQRPGRGYGAAEMGIAGTQAMAFSFSAVEALRAGEVPLGTLAMVVWTGALAVHGGYTVLRGPLPAEPPAYARRPAGVTWGVAPALVAGGRKQPGATAGAVLHGRF